MSIEELLIEKLTQNTNREKSTLLVFKDKTNEVSFDEVSEITEALASNIDGYISVMEANRENYAFRVLYSNRKWIGGVIVFFKRAVRKLLKWYIEPICFQQTEFNNAATYAIKDLSQTTAMLFQGLKTISHEQNLLKKSVKKTDTLVQDLLNDTKELEAQINAMEKELIEIKKLLEKKHNDA